jgi:thiol-disulfide isomerase/thioredoxin
MNGKPAFLYITLLCILLPLFSIAKPIKTGSWLLEFQIKKDKVLPVNLLIEHSKKAYTFFFINGEEKIEAKEYAIKGDSLFLKMPLFNSIFKLEIKNKKSISGNWHNYAKGPDYKIPVTLTAKITERFDKKNAATFSAVGKWKILFNYNDNHPWDGLGVFKTTEGITTGTFMTETGDYRFLQGNICGNKLQVSCFDGSHAFLFEANFEADSLKGTFYSGNHWSCNWYGTRDDNFELKDPNELTHIVDNKKFSFDAIDSIGNNFHFPNKDYKGKVTIIQIMGSWCPNCMDETAFYKELYNTYNKTGLEIISVGFEAGKDTEARQAQLERLKQHFKVNYPVYLGGKADKIEANKVFSALNHVMSFPTSIFIDKEGNVRKIHTGFNGKGTGTYYTNYVEQTKMLIEELLND